MSVLEREGDQIMIHVSLHAHRLVATAPDFRADTDRSAGDCPCPATVLLVGRDVLRLAADSASLGVPGYFVLSATAYVKSEM